MLHGQIYACMHAFIYTDRDKMMRMQCLYELRQQDVTLTLQ